MKTNEDQIEQLIKNFCDAFNRGNAQDVAELYTTDADFINIFGMRMKGKKAIEAGHQYAFSTLLKKSRLVVESFEIRFIKPEVAFAIVQWKREGESMLSTGTGYLSMGLVEHNGEWLFTSTQNTQTSSPPK